MSINKIISNEEVTLVQGIDGLFFHEESWITQRKKAIYDKKVLNKEVQGEKKDNLNDEPSYGNLLDLN